MTRIAFIGAGSFEFTRKLIRDILTFPRLQNSTFVLMDINAKHLNFARRAVQTIIKKGNYPAKVQTTLDRKKALKGADFVVCAILTGGTQVWRHDIEIPKKFGVDINVGDTRGPAGIFRALRTIPVMLEMCRDIERYCPEAYLLNYTNPMTILCRAMQRKTQVKLVGLCHSVQETIRLLAKWLNTPLDQITYLCAGINHQAWFIEFQKNGKDAYPLLRQVLRKKKIYNQEIVRNEMFLALDYYVTESSGHNSEYNWWFRKRSDLIEKYCLPGTGLNPGEYAWALKKYLNNEKTWKTNAEKYLQDADSISLERGYEFASYIINALQGGEPTEFNGNVPNTNLVTNLPNNACVEVPIVANRKGFKPISIGALPSQCAALNNINIASEEMAVEAALTGDAKLLYQAIAYDPLTAAVLSLAEIKKMVKQMLRKNKEYLPHFKNIDI